MVIVSLEVAVRYKAYPFANTSLLEIVHCNESHGTSALKLAPASLRRSLVTFSTKSDSLKSYQRMNCLVKRKGKVPKEQRTEQVSVALLLDTITRS